MVLRRVIAHFRRQEWTAIAIDFVIVVLGVFVGIQVSNWNQREADKRLGRAYAERLTTDIRKDLASRGALAVYYGAVLESVERTNALLGDPHSDPKQLVVSAYRASEINYDAQTRATWDEIVSSGDTGLLPRAALTSGVTDYYAVDSARLVFESVSNSAYRHRVRTVIPLEIQKALREGCSDVRNELQQIVGFMTDCTLAVPADAIASTAAALRADAGIQAELRYQYSEVFSAQANIGSDVKVLTRALAALENARTDTAESN
jgi:hypothetical protein